MDYYGFEFSMIMLWKDAKDYDSLALALAAYRYAIVDSGAIGFHEILLLEDIVKELNK